MFAYVARQPIFDENKDVYAYELLFRNGRENCFPDIEPDEATSKILANSHLSMGIEEITGGKKAFINFHQDTLLYRFPTSLDPKNVVIEVVETVNVNPQLTKACKHIRGLGYKLALDDYDGTSRWLSFLPFVSVVKIEVGAYSEEELQELVTTLKQKFNMTLVAERVETKEQFEHYRELGFDYFQGYFLAKPEIVRHKRISASQLSMLELLGETAVSPLNFDKISKIFEHDAALTFKLLRFINNPTFDKRVRISSLRHAFNYMGEIELKKFIALLALANLSDRQPGELLIMSLVRARFCEITVKTLEQTEHHLGGFLTGLLSLMDTLTGITMPELMTKLPIDDEVKKALCEQNGMLRDALTIVTAFEHADWVSVKAFSQKYKIKQYLLHSIFLESMKWAHTFK